MNQKEANQIISKIRKSYPIDHPLTEKELVAFVQYLVKKKAFLPTDKVSVEYYTPKWLISLIKKVSSTSEIDLDPASNEIANKTVKAKNFYTEEHNGIKQDWDGRTIFCNPPYGKNTEGKYEGNRNTPVAKLWLQKALIEYDRNPGIDCIFMLVNRTGAKWYRETLTKFDLICEFESRIAFDIVGSEGKRVTATSPGYYNDLLFLGDKEAQLNFIEIFDKNGIGKVIKP